MELNATTVTTILATNINHNPGQAIHLSGPPGVGKTSLVYAAAKEAGIPEDRVLLLRPALMDPVDLLGVPAVTDGSTSFCPPANLLAFAEGTGPGVILIDELPQSAVAMQNALGGLLLEGRLGALTIDKQVARISTGNRVQDKAGASRLLSQIGNRICHLELGASLDDWSKWALGAGVDPHLIAFMRMRPNLLHDFDPDRMSNPTPRSWEMVSRIPKTLPEHAYHAMCSGLVGQGAAAEWVGTRKILDDMPSIDGILAAPMDAALPTEPVIRYAIASSLALQVNPRTFPQAMQYMTRLPLEFQALFVSLVHARDRDLLAGPAFNEWAASNSHMLF